MPRTKITQVGAWSVLRSDDGLDLLLEHDGELIDGIFAPDTMPPQLSEELHRPENIAQLVLLVNYFKFYDKFTPLLTQALIDDHMERHRGGPIPKMPTYGNDIFGEKTLIYFAEAPIRGNPLYRIVCQCPVTDKSPCDAKPA